MRVVTLLPAPTEIMVALAEAGWVDPAAPSSANVRP
jgi:hypothetical protein